jgi:hypothetical protein
MSVADTSRYFLAFDSACSSCSKLSQTIRELSDGRLLPISLHDPQVATWRAEILGGHARWEPTLFRLGTEGNRAWTGRSMVWKLVGLLGPSRSWKLARSISASQQESSVPNPSRRAFFAKSAALALGLTLLGPRLVWPASAKNSGDLAIEPADSDTTNRLTAGAAGDAHYQLLARHLMTSGFNAVGLATPLTLRKNSQILRSVLLTEFKGPDGRSAAQYFGIEAQDASSWSIASITTITSKDVSVEILEASTGRVSVAATDSALLPPGGLSAATSSGPPPAAAALGPHLELGMPAEANALTCFICGDLCGGLCAYGTTRACFLICFIDPPCLAACGVVAVLVCFGGCVFGCNHFPWWTTPFCP